MTKKSDTLDGRNPLTHDEVRELARDTALRDLSQEQARGLLLLFHAFTYEMSMATREGMFQAVKEEYAYIFPAFDKMMQGEIADRLAALKGGDS